MELKSEIGPPNAGSSSILDALLLALKPETARWSRDLNADQVKAIGAVLAHAADTFGSAEKAERWLRRPNAVVGGVPLERMIDLPQAVDDELTRIDHGVYV